MKNILSPQNRPQITSRHLKQLAAITAVLLIFIVVFLWFFNHSFIKVTVETPVNGEVSYALVNQKTKKSIEATTKSSTIKKLVKKGTYEILIKNSETSSLSVESTKPFLKTTSVNSQLQQEKSRAFVGDNPSPCMDYDQFILVSYACSGDYRDASAHLPATAGTPTITQNDADDFENLSFGGLIKINDKKMAFTEGHYDVESTEQENRLFEIGDKLEPSNGQKLPGLSSEKVHRINKYRDGFLVFSNDYSDIKYFSSPAELAENIEITAPEDSELGGQQLSIEAARIALAYSSPDRDLEAEENEKSKGGETTSVQVYENGKTKSFLFKGSFYLAQLCGGKYLCMVQDRELGVYDISGERAKEIIRVGNVYNLKSAGDNLLIVRYDGVFEFDVEKRYGYMQYSFGEYTPCGVELAQDKGYVLCMINPKKDKVALYVDPENNNTDSIDKKVLKLLSLPYISTVSAYKSFIYISPELGELEYDSNARGYIPNPEIKQKANEDINNIISEIGIDRSAYKIINTRQ